MVKKKHTTDENKEETLAEVIKLPKSDKKKQIEGEIA